jgi:hypothetical protein
MDAALEEVALNEERLREERYWRVGWRLKLDDTSTKWKWKKLRMELEDTQASVTCHEVLKTPRANSWQWCVTEI